jgi:hypothetical protein
MLDPWVARAERHRWVRRRVRRLLVILGTFAALAGTAAAVAVLAGPARSPMESRSPASVSSAVRAGAVPGESDCRKAVPWMLVCGGRGRMARRSGAG